jgi:hypothetical protein
MGGVPIFWLELPEAEFDSGLLEHDVMAISSTAAVKAGSIGQCAIFIGFMELQTNPTKCLGTIFMENWFVGFRTVSSY